ncbi:hypothetical protein QR680_007026 [Steinernema hermaphroditum]|uniref:C2H2-type domain-containing protein n=1 Tax=Steinernema hermaphroditum TaxID=289476 RepID=A0AA39LY29_9BILA|nr:hypothetical protein QR680_007026 [Steinernema hermaphroditum]
MEYANELQGIKKEEEASGDTMTPVERRDVLDDDSNSSSQPPQKKNRVTPDQAIFNYLYQQKQNDLLQLMFDEETRVEYTNKVEQMGAAMPQIQRMYAYYCRNKPVKKEVVEESSDLRRGTVKIETAVETIRALEHAVRDSQQQQVTNPRRSARLRARSLVKKPDVVGVEDEKSSNEDPKQQSTPREDGPIHLNDCAVLILNVPARTITRANKSKEAQEANDRADVRRKKERVKDSRKVQFSSDQAIFYYFHERKRSDVLDAIFDGETRQEYVNKVKEVRCERPSIMRMYAHWRRIELKKTIKNGMEIWKCQVCKEEKKANGALKLLTHIGTHEGISYACIVEGCGSFLKPYSFRAHLRKIHGFRADQLEQQQYHKLRVMEKSFYIEARTKMNNYFPPEAFLRFDRNVSKKAQFEDPNCRECGLVVKMDASTPSAPPFDAHGLIYNFVKRRNPRLLLEMFGKERCRELEQRDHLYDKNTLKSMVEAYKKSKRPTEGDEHSMQKQAEAKGKRTSPSDLKITPQLATFYYLYERKRRVVLEAIFDEETRKEFTSKVEKMGIDMPSILRTYAYWRRIELKKTVKRGIEIWRCQLCEKEIKATGVQDLINHIGTHEGGSCSCLVAGCGKLMKPKYLRNHLMNIHALHADHLDKEQYHKLRRTLESFYKKAKTQRNKYFPPEAFLRFDDKKMSNKNLLEDPKCRECGQMVHAETTRRLHVAQHLNLLYKCVVDGCEFRADPIRLVDHLSKNHLKKVAQLTAEELFELKRIRVVFKKVMDNELHKFFPYKEDIPAGPFRDLL